MYKKNMKVFSKKNFPFIFCRFFATRIRPGSIFSFHDTDPNLAK